MSKTRQLKHFVCYFHGAKILFDFLLKFCHNYNVFAQLNRKIKDKEHL